MKKIYAAAGTALALCASMLTGCHGQREQTAFSVPEEFDITARPLRIFRPFTRIFPLSCACTRITEIFTMM